MENITSITELKKAIQLLEDEQAFHGELLKEQFFLTYESLKPLNLLKNTIKDVASSPWLIENILGTALSLTTGYVSKKIVIGTSGNIFRKLLGSVLQFGVTNAVAQNQDSIKSFGQLIYNKFFHKKENLPTQEE
jgi:hypothetical protein